MTGAAGAPPVTSIVTVAVADPPVFVAVTVYVAEAEFAVGVPLMRPDAELKDNPAGSAGEIVQLVAVPPELVGVNDEIAVPITPAIDVGLREIFGAGTES